ncbi:SGNH/GDSL hydrolase family protein [Streptomyces cellostaticus]|uniref:SGNH/GDSL hydrolase family protein n=1 Tax=Streptomyces cellostaticus TaxID=67285 RepID=UPI002025C751|nr:SGNH/GDSL hydrolase family protein [Streptomyces cellostaticus]
MTGRSARVRRLAAAVLITLACQGAPVRAAAGPPAAGGRAGQVVTWAAGADRLGEGAADRGYRLVVHTSVAGSALRVRLSNAFGDRPLTVDSVHVGLRRTGAALVPGSDRPLTFGGARSVTLPAGTVAWSDPRPGTVPAGADLAVSLHTPDAAGPATGHELAMQTSYIGQGDHTAETSGANWTRPTGSWWYLDAVSVRPADPATGAVVVLGDSLTDGWQSTAGLDRRWPDFLARRLHAAPTAVKAVANEGMSGNKVLSDDAGTGALHRLQRDVLTQPGARTVLLFEGVNDLKAHTGVTAADLIAGYRTIVRQAHAAGLCVVGATIAPFEGWSEWDPAAEAVRQEVNRFVRTGGEFDAAVDFDRVLRSPQLPRRLLSDFDNGDHLHLGDAGMRAMAEAVDPHVLDCAR